MMLDEYPFVSVVSAIRNESRHIRACLKAALEQDYPPERIEILVVDGMSDDGTREIVADLAKHDPRLQLFDNPQKHVTPALNIGIRASRGQVVIILDGHTTLAPDYVRRCVDALNRTGADNVGGPMRAAGETFWGRVIALATSTPFGVGNAFFHYASKPGWVDTVYMGAYRREVFDHIGLFDEDFIINQDDELNYRLIRAGGRIWLDPQIRSTYWTRPTISSFARQYFRYGFWKVSVIRKHLRPSSLRHLVPASFLMTLSVLGMMGLFWGLPIPFLWLFMLYVFFSLVATLSIVVHKGWRYAPFLPLAFAAMHFCYGTGFLVGLIRLISLHRRNRDYSPSRSSHTELLGRLHSINIGASDSKWEEDHGDPFVSVIMPIRNERRNISESLGAVLAQDYPFERMEIIIVDGLSTDGTREILTGFASKDSRIQIIDNSSQIVSTAMNLGIRKAHGGIIIRVDGHTIIAPDYVRRCVDGLNRTGADNVGGPMRAAGETFWGRVIALATSTPFGVGNAFFHYASKPGWVDTVYMGAYRREVFDHIGLFDETLVRDQDDELNYRLIRADGRIWLDPRIQSTYFPRNKLQGLWRQYFEYGFWKVSIVKKHGRPASWRHVVPSIFILALAISVIASILTHSVVWFLVVTCPYVFVSLASSFWLGSSNGWRSSVALPIAFATMHFAYGLGFLDGIARFFLAMPPPVSDVNG